MGSDKLVELAQSALEDLKAREIKVLDVQKLTSVADYLVVASGTSKRHVQSVAQNVVDVAKQAGEKPIGVEGTESGEWVLIDLADVIVHVMQPSVREFYKLEDLWTVGADAAAGQSPA